MTYARKLSAGVLLFLMAVVALGAAATSPAPISFEVSVSKTLPAGARAGRLFVVLARTTSPDPCFDVGRSGGGSPQALARDVEAFAPGAVAVLDGRTAFAFPVTNLSALPAGDYVAQALLDCNPDKRYIGAPGSLYSKTQKIHFDPAQGGAWNLELTQEVPELQPKDTEQFKNVRLQSKRLSEFYGRPMFLRATVLLPRDYAREPSRRYPLWVRIGGLNTHCTKLYRLAGPESELARTWLADDTPRLLLLQLDGVGPNGDPYFVNSANNGPYGDAVTAELIPYVESAFRAVGQPRARFLSGTSTGGWVCLALQIFYPDYFNGAWSSCPDPVDFRALELINIYKDDNAYVNKHGYERPSTRDSNGDVVLTVRSEVALENFLGRGNSYTLSGGQWGDWNAVFGPPGADGRPVPLFDPQTGKIDHAVAEVDGEVADAALGRFGKEKEQFIAVLEGKGTRDPLERPFGGRRMSAVDQAYRYAINLPCDWIIVTSMRETRLHRKGTELKVS